MKIKISLVTTDATDSKPSSQGFIKNVGDGEKFSLIILLKWTDFDHITSYLLRIGYHILFENYILYILFVSGLYKLGRT
jgi:hypothetical protein